MKILVCGGRYYSNAELMARVLIALRPTKIIHGAARGADALAAQCAEISFVDAEAFPADWYPNKDGKVDRSAGPRRNAQMLKEKPDLVLAFPGGVGTENMVKQARAKGFLVLRVEP